MIFNYLIILIKIIFSYLLIFFVYCVTMFIIDFFNEIMNYNLILDTYKRNL